MPWDLIFVDLDNGAQLMLAALAFHETDKGTLTPLIGPDQPTYRVLATLRLPDGDRSRSTTSSHVEHLIYRRVVGRVPTFRFRSTGSGRKRGTSASATPAATSRAGDGARVTCRRSTSGWCRSSKAEPALDERGNGMAQRVPFVARGSYGGCPVRGSAGRS